MGAGLIVGEPGGGRSARVERVVTELARAGFDAKLSERIQQDIWYKLWGNMTMNPVSAITGATGDRILDDPLVRAFCSAAMAEAAAIGAKIGCGVTQSADDRNAVTRKLGAFKTSMLQDVEAGRPIELDAIVAVVREIGEKVGVPTPNIDALLGLARLFARVRGLY
jgi:2-dehydropantoate 2-reductase